MFAALALVSVGCERQVQITRLNAGAVSSNPSLPPVPVIPASVTGVNPSQDPGATLPAGSTNEVSSLDGTYTLSRYQCLSPSGTGSPIYMEGSLGTQSETLSFSSGHMHDVVSYSLGCTVILDYNVVWATETQINLSSRQYSVLYMEQPDSQNHCAAAVPSAGDSGDAFILSYTRSDPMFAFDLRDASTSSYCGADDALQSVYVKN